MSACSIGEVNNIFSYEQFKGAIQQSVPVFKLVLDIAESRDAEADKELSALPIPLPLSDGSETLSSLVGISKVLNFVNDSYLAATFAAGAFEKLQSILEAINKRRAQAREDAINTAIDEERVQLASQQKEFTDEAASYVGVAQGELQVGRVEITRNVAFTAVQGVLIK